MPLVKRVLPEWPAARAGGRHRFVAVPHLCGVVPSSVPPSRLRAWRFDPNAWGWAGYRDVDAAVKFLGTRSDVEAGRIGGIGLSVGEEMMIEAAARSDGLNAVVSEGAGERSVRELLDMTTGDRWLQLPGFATLNAGPVLFGAAAPPPSLKDLVGRISPTPVFLIYGEHGQPGERNLNPTYYAAASAPKRIWEVPGSGHVGGITAHPSEYERRVVGFFGRTLFNED
jgi:uncharacterized protein